MAKHTSTTTEQAIDLAALYSEVESTIKSSVSGETGKYLPWSFIQEDAATVIKFLCQQRGNSVETGVVRQFLTVVLTKKIEALPEGGDRMVDTIGRARVEVTKTEYRTRKLEQLKASSKSSNSGPTITRLLGNPACRKWLKEKHGITFDGMWKCVDGSKDNVQGE